MLMAYGVRAHGEYWKNLNMIFTDTSSLSLVVLMGPTRNLSLLVRVRGYSPHSPLREPPRFPVSFSAVLATGLLSLFIASPVYGYLIDQL